MRGWVNRIRGQRERGEDEIQLTELQSREDEDESLYDDPESLRAPGSHTEKAPLDGRGLDRNESNNEFISENALAGTDWQLKMGGLCLATLSLRHFLPLSVVYSFFKGPVATSPFLLRSMFGLACGLLILKVRAGGFRHCSSLRAVCLCLCMIFDFVFSIIMMNFTFIVMDSLLRETSPSKEVNVYWQGTYSFFSFTSVLDILLAPFPAIFLFRALHTSRYSHWQPKRDEGVRRLLNIVLVRPSLLPDRHSVSALRVLTPICLLFFIVAAVISLMVGAVFLGVFGSWIPGQRCDTTAMGDANCYVLDGACDMIDPSECLFPFPSSFYMRPDSQSSTGWKVRIPIESSLPLNSGGRVTLDLDAWNVLDGFSILAPILFRVGDGKVDVDRKSLRPDNQVSQCPEDSIPFSVDLDRCHTLLIDVETAQPVPHFVELDVALKEEGRGYVLVLQPAVPLRYSAHYVVAARRLRNVVDNQLIQPSTTFVALRDGSGDPQRQAAFEDSVFSTLARAGWQRQELQIAWDFRTASWEGSEGRARHMVLDSLEQMRSSFFVPKLKVHDVVKEQCDSGVGRGRQVWGSMEIPSYTSQPGPGYDLFTIFKGGVPIRNGNVEVQFASLLPCSVLKRKKAEFILNYGHGILGTRAEAVQQRWLEDLANYTHSVLFAVDFAGMSKFDLPIIFKILLNDLSAFKVVPAQLMQGFVNGACGIWYMRNMLRTDSSFKSGGSEIFSSSTPAYFYGVSMGGVLGAGYTLSSPYLARSVLSVPGTPFALLLMRSLDFKSYLKILKIQILRPTHLRLAMSLMQQLWDPGESSGWLGHNASFSGKRFLIQAAEGDAQVSIIGADILARALGAVRFSSPRHKYGIAEVAPAADGYLQEGQARALFTEFYYEGVQPQPQFNLPAAEATDSHELPRRDDRGFRQVAAFLKTGNFLQTCSSDGCVGPYQPMSTM